MELFLIFYFSLWREFGAFLFIWQELIGALVGAGIPLLTFLLGRSYFAFKEHTERIEKALVVAINNLIDVDNNIEKFIDGNLKGSIEALSTAPHDTASIGKVFFPLMFVYELPDVLFDGNTGSNYVGNMVIKVLAKSKDMPLIIADMQRQLQATLDLHTTILESKIGTPESFNLMQLKNLSHYSEFLENYWFPKILPVYLTNLVETRTALTALRKPGPLRGLILWRIRYSLVSFKVFRDRRSIKKFLDGGASRVEKSLRAQMKADLASIRALLSSRGQKALLQFDPKDQTDLQQESKE